MHVRDQNHGWRIILIALLLALAIGSAGQTPSVQAAPASYSDYQPLAGDLQEPGSIQFRFFTLPTRKPVCVGEKVEIFPYLGRYLWPSDPNFREGLGGSWQSLPGIVIHAAMADGPIIGKISPAQDTTDLSSLTQFVFLAENPGESFITFEATVETPGWFGTSFGGDTQSGIINHPIKVINCKFNVTTIADWNDSRLLGGYYESTAVSDEALVTAGADGQFSGSAAVNWIGHGKGPGSGCIFPIQIASGRVNYTGRMDESGQLALNQTFDPVESSYSYDCAVSNPSPGGLIHESGFGDGLFTSEPLVFSMPASGGVSTLPNIVTLEWYGPVAGSVTVVVIPVEDVAAAFNVGTQMAFSPWIFSGFVGLVLTHAFKNKRKKPFNSKPWIWVLLVVLTLLVMSSCGTQVTDDPLTGAQVTDSPLTGAQVTDSPPTGAQVTDGPPTGAQVTDGPPTGTQVTDSAAADSQDLNGLTVQADLVFGPGDFVLPDTNAGLADLSSYKATLALSFNGTRDGQAELWSRTYVILNAQEPSARQLTIEISGDVSDPEAKFMAEVDGAAYERRGQTACSATVIDPQNSQIERLHPVGFLNGVIGAEAAGSETINDVAADHYTFDERAFGQLGIAKSTGEIWVASEGGYILRYVLTTEGDESYFGEGIEGTLTWNYELTDVNQPITFSLPNDCPAGMVDAPTLPDATNILNMPSILTYDTASNVADAAAFYQEQIPNLGWALIGEPAITETNALMKFTQGDQNMMVIITADGVVTTITILLGKAQE